MGRREAMQLKGPVHCLSHRSCSPSVTCCPNPSLYYLLISPDSESCFILSNPKNLLLGLDLFL